MVKKLEEELEEVNSGSWTLKEMINFYHSFIHLFNKHLLKSYSVPGILVVIAPTVLK